MFLAMGGIVLIVTVGLMYLAPWDEQFNSGKVVATATPVPTSVEVAGYGDETIPCDLNMGVYHIEVMHLGDGPFLATLYDEFGESKRLVYTGRNGAMETASLHMGLGVDPGPCHIEVVADGEWSLNIQLE
jgi:hypothetical protein